MKMDTKFRLNSNEIMSTNPKICNNKKNCILPWNAGSETAIAGVIIGRVLILNLSCDAGFLLLLQKYVKVIVQNIIN